eukprot:scaffold859_cov306-Pinguiococcus_pyrenoidosus.AAC.15
MDLKSEAVRIWARSSFGGKTLVDRCRERLSVAQRLSRLGSRGSSFPPFCATTDLSESAFDPRGRVGGRGAGCRFGGER